MKLKREAASGVGRLKWDAKVRMKQAKLRAAGENVDRQEVVEAIIEESVKAAQDGVMERFDEIARERGFHEGAARQEGAIGERERERKSGRERGRLTSAEFSGLAHRFTGIVDTFGDILKSARFLSCATDKSILIR